MILPLSHLPKGLFRCPNARSKVLFSHKVRKKNEFSLIGRQTAAYKLFVYRWLVNIAALTVYICLPIKDNIWDDKASSCHVKNGLSAWHYLVQWQHLSSAISAKLLAWIEVVTSQTFLLHYLTSFLTNLHLDNKVFFYLMIILWTCTISSEIPLKHV